MRTEQYRRTSGAEDDAAHGTAPDEQHEQDRFEREPAAARRGADAKLGQERAQRRRRSTQDTVSTSSGGQVDGRDADGLARSRYAADRAAATARHPSGPPAPRR